MIHSIFPTEVGVVKIQELQGQYQNLQNKILGMQYKEQELDRHLHFKQRQKMELTDTQNTLQVF
jgi:hypothetical protein